MIYGRYIKPVTWINATLNQRYIMTIYAKENSVLISVLNLLYGNLFETFKKYAVEDN